MALLYLLFMCNFFPNIHQSFLKNVAVFKLLTFLLTLYEATKLDRTKLKEFVDEKFKFAKMKISVHYRLENIFGKGENAGYQHFLLFQQCFRNLPMLESLKHGIVRLPAFFPSPTMFSKLFFLGVVKSRHCVVQGNMK